MRGGLRGQEMKGAAPGLPSSSANFTFPCREWMLLTQDLQLPLREDLQLSLQSPWASQVDM
jgi:hypothetical protein